LHDHDQELGGLHPGELIVLAARPRMGKTALALQFARQIAEDGRHVLFVSLEMAGSELANRALCGIAGVDGSRVRNGRLSERDLTLLEFAGERLAKAALHLVDAPSVTVGDIRATAKALHRRHRLSLVVVDYLQRVTADDRRLQRYQQLGQISGDLKRLARELGVPVLALAQLSRELESDKKPRPRLSHLRESGDIEADADVVLLLHREEVYRRDADLRGKALLIVAKNRNGPSEMDFKLRWEAATTTFAAEGDPKGVDWETANASEDGFDPWACPTA
jgi:replicative DNA helicase